MATYTAIADGNWSDGPTTWGTAAGVYPGYNANGDVVVIGTTRHVTLDATAIASLATYSLASITGSGTTAYISCALSATITLTGATGITYTGTNAVTGFIAVTAGTLTLVGNGANTTTVTCSTGGYVIKTTTTGILIVNNSGGVAFSNTSSGWCFLADTWSVTNVINGACSATGSAAVVAIYAGTVRIDGNLSCGATGTNGYTSCVLMNYGTFQWGDGTPKTYTLAANTDLWLQSTGYPGASLIVTNVTLNNSGNFVITFSGSAGTLSQAGFSVAQQTATAHASSIGRAAITVTGPSIPTAANTLYSGSATYGYAGALFDGTLTLPNNGNSPYTPDPSLVLTTGHYGAGNATQGTYVAPVAAGYSELAPGFGAAGGTAGTLADHKIFDGTYGTLTASSILVAAGGSYVDPANSDVWHGVSVGVSPRVGTKAASSIANLSVGNIKSGVTIDDVGPGTFTHTADYGLLTDYTDPGKDNVVVGHDYTYSGASQTASYQTTATSKAAQLLDDKDANVRGLAVEELGNLKDKRAIDALVRHLEDKDVGRYAADALNNLGFKTASRPATGSTGN